MCDRIMHECNNLPEDFGCEDCAYNIGIYNSSGRIDGPCGQQNCWYSCVTCSNHETEDCKLYGWYDEDDEEA